MSSDSPAVKDLPKIQDSLKGELLSPRHLKETHVAEKNVLPTAEDVAAEKTHQGLIQGEEKALVSLIQTILIPLLHTPRQQVWRSFLLSSSITSRPASRPRGPKSSRQSWHIR